MVKIRLARAGTNKTPFYHIVVADNRNKRDGRYIERIGFFNPIAKGKDATLKIATDRVEYWLAKGAKATDRVNKLIKVNQAGAAGL